MKHDELLWASWKSNFKAIRRLLAAGGNPQVLLWTPLMLAIATGTIDDVRRELQDNPNLHLEDCHHRTAWLLACAVGDVHKARLLREHGAELDIRSIEWAVRANHVRMLHWLLWLGLKPEDTGQYSHNALFAACEWGAPKCVKLLLEIGMDANMNGYYGQKPINVAKNADVVRLLINAGADINYTGGLGYSILLTALEEQNIEFVRTLLELDADPNTGTFSRTPLWYAVITDNYEAAKILLEAGANPNQKPEEMDSRFPVEVAESSAMIELLLEYGADRAALKSARKRQAKLNQPRKSCVSSNKLRKKPPKN